jgi:hypothetical protein
MLRDYPEDEVTEISYGINFFGHLQKNFSTAFGGNAATAKGKRTKGNHVFVLTERKPRLSNLSKGINLKRTAHRASPR